MIRISVASHSWRTLFLLLCSLILVLAAGPRLLAAGNMNMGYVAWMKTVEHGICGVDEDRGTWPQ